MGDFVNYTAIVIAYVCAALLLMRIAGRLQRPFTTRKVLICLCKIWLVVFALKHLEIVVSVFVFALPVLVCFFIGGLTLLSRPRDRHSDIETLHGTV